MISKKNLVFLGPPGAGKGTISEALLGVEDITHISTGDIFRAEIKAQSELGKMAKDYIDKGQLVPDEVVAGMVGSRLAQDDCDKGFILDGFPRTLPQAEMLSIELEKCKRTLDCVVYFAAADEVLLERLTARILCKQCGKVYNKLFMPPKNADICDDCKGEIYQRSDDSLETAQDRLKVYHDQTSPLIEYYQKQELLFDINSVQTKAEVLADLLKVIG